MLRTDVTLEFIHDGRAAVIRIPGGRLGRRAAREFVDVTDELVEQREVRVVLVHSFEADFCSGPAADLDRFDLSPDPASALARLRPPVLVACTGECSSVGLEIALAADIRFAEPASSFALADVLDGEFPSWGGTQRLPRAIRPSAAVGMLLLGDRLDADQAHGLGLVHAVEVDALGAAMSVLERLQRAAPLALEFAKEAVHRGSEMPLRDGLRLEGDLNHLLASTVDRAEGLAAFFAKRPPDFAGR